ncbi:hypothetical protein M758_1G063100 [Ceratodon purpureus]|nr:hypothetical protein M758_1G063100 [Ceratodon purpureus]
MYRPQMFTVDNVQSFHSTLLNANGSPNFGNLLKSTWSSCMLHPFIVSQCSGARLHSLDRLPEYAKKLRDTARDVTLIQHSCTHFAYVYNSPSKFQNITKCGLVLCPSLPNNDSPITYPSPSKIGVTYM